mmetsp:Transcript_42614/g.40895  ORF Transcript_42614/g.40895 Transcript_42614/m.40895 type:complete len:108 (-) Transcript_42614:1043-1366(-)
MSEANLKRLDKTLQEKLGIKVEKRTSALEGEQGLKSSASMRSVRSGVFQSSGQNILNAKASGALRTSLPTSPMGHKDIYYNSTIENSGEGKLQPNLELNEKAWDEIV